MATWVNLLAPENRQDIAYFRYPDRKLTPVTQDTYGHVISPSVAGRIDASVFLHGAIEIHAANEPPDFFSEYEYEPDLNAPTRWRGAIVYGYKVTIASTDLYNPEWIDESGTVVQDFYPPNFAVEVMFNTPITLDSDSVSSRFASLFSWYTFDGSSVPQTVTRFEVLVDFSSPSSFWTNRRLTSEREL